MGIDPGLANTGFGVVRVAGSRMTAIDGGTIEVGADMPPEQRLRKIHESLIELIDWHSPESVALESLYFGKNVRSAIAVGQARGVIMLAAAIQRPRLLRLHAAGRQARRLRQRRRRQGPGQAHGRRPARPSGRAALRPRRRRPRGRRLPRRPPAGSVGAPAVAAAARGAAPRSHSIDRGGQRRDPLAGVPTTSSSTPAASATGSPSPPRRCGWIPPAGQHVFLHAHLIVPRRLAGALRLRDRGRARALPLADLASPASARRSRSRRSRAAPSGSCCARSPAGTRSASRRSRGSASEPPSGSSSSCARRSPGSSRRTVAP